LQPRCRSKSASGAEGRARRDHQGSGARNFSRRCRHRVFADLEPRCGRFPCANDQRIGAKVMVLVLEQLFRHGQHLVRLAVIAEATDVRASNLALTSPMPTFGCSPSVGPKLSQFARRLPSARKRKPRQPRNDRRASGAQKLRCSWGGRRTRESASGQSRRSTPIVSASA
jgi:hypothetical protein